MGAPLCSESTQPSKVCNLPKVILPITSAGTTITVPSQHENSVRHLLVQAALLLAVSTGTHAQTQPVELLKIREPATIRMENNPHIALAGLAILGISKARNSGMSDRLTSEIYRLNPAYAELLTSQLKRHLEAAAIPVTDGPMLAVDPAKPWNYKPQQITATSPTALYVYFESIGIRSHHQNSYYQPAMHILYCLMTPKNPKDCTDSQRIAFGDNYDQEDETTILATPGERWFDDQSAYLRVGEIDQALKRGITIAAERIAKQLTTAMSAAQ